jgi:hypothetical protein
MEGGSNPAWGMDATLVSYAVLSCVGIVVARRLASYQSGASGEEGRCCAPESLPDLAESSAVRELESTIRKTSGDTIEDLGWPDPR